MIELLILYLLNNSDKTVYGIHKEITANFKMVTKPSLGTIHPALKRLLNLEAVKFDKKFSQGGKKSTFYSITPKGKELFNELFMKPISDNPTIFHNHLMARLLTISMLDNALKTEFFDNLDKNLEIYKIEIENSLHDKYTNYDEPQKAVIKAALDSVKTLFALAAKLRSI